MGVRAQDEGSDLILGLALEFSTKTCEQPLKRSQEMQDHSGSGSI